MTLSKVDETTLHGRELTRGETEFTAKGIGRCRFYYLVTEASGTQYVEAWEIGRGKWRSIPLDRITRVYRTTTTNRKGK